MYVSFPGGTTVKNLPADAGDAKDRGSIHGLGRSPQVGNGNHFCILAWKIPWTEEPSGLQFRGHDRSHTHSAELGMFGLLWLLSSKESACQGWRCTFYPWVGWIPWRRKCQPTPLFLPGKSRGQRSLADCSPQGRKKSSMT